MIAYLTDVEGRWDKLASFADGNPHVSLAGDSLRLADGVTFVFGGDAIDRGPSDRRFLKTLLAARREYGDRVVMLAGNRDINKLRLVRELAGKPPAKAPATTTRGELLRWIFANTMGAGKAFDHRATELGSVNDEMVVASYLDDLAPGGLLREYLDACQLGFRAGGTLFLHGGVTAENFGMVPGAEPSRDVDGWLAALDRFYRDELAAFAAGREPAALIAYQAPQRGSRSNPYSVVYARPADDDANPRLPAASVIGRLRDSGITRLVVGHTPSGDCPAILRDTNFELILADNSYSRVELGSQVAIGDREVHIRGFTQLDDGTQHRIDYTAQADDPNLGRRDRRTGQLVKARLDSERYLLFRGLPKYQVEQIAATVAGRELEPAR
ncbi:MAG: metallophosphoesterase [Kofleriaceae bacterium]